VAEPLPFSEVRRAHGLLDLGPDPALVEELRPVRADLEPAAAEQEVRGV
jgi:hypothetical protein